MFSMKHTSKQIKEAIDYWTQVLESYDNQDRSANFYVYMLDMKTKKTVVSEYFNINDEVAVRRLIGLLKTADVTISLDRVIEHIRSVHDKANRVFDVHNNRFIGFITDNENGIPVKS